MIPPADRWGPFADGLEPGERIARLRCLRALTHVLCGHRGLALQAAIRAAEAGRTMGLLDAVVVEIERLAALDRRHVLASYLAVSREPRP